MTVFNFLATMTAICICAWAMRHLKSGGAQLVQVKADQRQETYRARLNRELELYTRRINHPPLIHNGKKAR